jgi:hypothetical protein
MSTLLPLGWYGRFWYQKRPAPSRWQCCFPAALELEFGNGAFEPRKMLGKGPHSTNCLVEGKIQRVKHGETWWNMGWEWVGLIDGWYFASSFSSYNKNIGEIPHPNLTLKYPEMMKYAWVCHADPEQQSMLEVEGRKKQFLRVWELVEGEGCRQKTASKYDWHKATRFFSRPTGQVLGSWMLAGKWMSMLPKYGSTTWLPGKKLRFWDGL